MSAARYRTLDGDEVELPLAMGCWVIVPRALARFDPELAWTLDYEDAPEPDCADPRLDFSAGALLVPVSRWNEHAELEPNLARCNPPPDAAWPPSLRLDHVPCATITREERGRRAVLGRIASGAARAAVAAIAALAVSYLAAVGAWLWSLRDGISGPSVSTGLMLVGAAVLLAWLAGVAGVAWGSVSPDSARHRVLLRPTVAVIDHPLDILRLGLAVQMVGFVVLTIAR